MCRPRVPLDYTVVDATIERSIRRDDARLVRIGDRERDEAAAALSDHYALGRLDRDEFSSRLDAALAARTRGDLDKLFVDLPRGHARRTTSRRERRRPAVVPIGAIAAVALIVASVAAVAHGFPPFFLFALLFIWRGHRHAWR